MIEVEFIGGAQTVTGSRHLVRTSRASVLLECGLFQGRRQESFSRNRERSVDVDDLDAVVLSHAHIDHSGALPLLHKQGYRGPIHMTPATRDLLGPMLEDAAMLQDADARHIRRLIERGDSNLTAVEPLYGRADVVAMLGNVLTSSYRREVPIAPGISLTFLDAGHVLGSAIVVLNIQEDGQHTRLAFTGDLGRHHLPILRDPEIPDGVHALLMESTYGDRLHPPLEEMDDALAAAVNRVAQRRGKIIIPSFALERAQEVVYVLKRLRQSGRIPPIPVYVDSPLTIRLTEVFKLHPDCYDAEAAELLRGGDSPFEFDGLHYLSEVEDSMAIDAAPGPSIIISASGMCEGGRVLHHLRTAIGDDKNMIMIVGFQAEHTLGRRLVERRPEVRIFGLMHERRAEVLVLNGFSAHADQKDLITFAESVRQRGKLRQVLLVHGEPKAQKVLAGLLEDRGFPQVLVPARGDRVRI